jgi:hypothetical protein
VACIAGGISDAYYGSLPKQQELAVRTLLPLDLLEVVNRFRDDSVSLHEALKGGTEHTLSFTPMLFVGSLRINSSKVPTCGPHSAVAESTYVDAAVAQDFVQG